MQIKTNQTIKISEEEVKEMIVFYMKEKYGQDVKVTHVRHDEKSWTEGHGMMERDYSKPDGLTVTCEEK